MMTFEPLNPTWSYSWFLQFYKLVPYLHQSQPLLIGFLLLAVNSVLVAFLNKCSLNIFSHVGAIICSATRGQDPVSVRSLAQSRSEPRFSRLWNMLIISSSQDNCKDSDNDCQWPFPLPSTTAYSTNYHTEPPHAHITLLCLVLAPTHMSSPLLEIPLPSLLCTLKCFKVLFRHHLLWEAVSEVSQDYWFPPGSYSPSAETLNLLGLTISLPV